MKRNGNKMRRKEMYIEHNTDILYALSSKKEETCQSVIPQLYPLSH